MPARVIFFRIAKLLSLACLASICFGQIGWVDSPQFQATGSGSWSFNGWAMASAAPIKNVEVHVDGTDFGAANYGSNRADACAAVGNYPGCPNVGWSVVLNTATLPDGPHMLQLVVTATNGQQSTLLQPFLVDNAGRGLDSTTSYEIVNCSTGSVLDVTGGSIATGQPIQEWRYSGGANQLWTAVPTSDGDWVFESLNSAKSISVPFGQTANGTVVEQIEDYGVSDQEWSMVGTGNGTYALFNVATGLALDLRGGSASNGTPVQIYPYKATSNQKWSFVPVTDLQQQIGTVFGGAKNTASESVTRRSSIQASVSDE